MTINITNPQLIERQHAMNGLGLHAEQIVMIMGASDEMLAKQAEIGRDVITKISGQKLIGAQNMLRALEIEAGLRGVAI